MNPKRSRRRKRLGISRVLTEVIILIIVIGAVAMAALYFTGTLSALTGSSQPVLMVNAVVQSVDYTTGKGTLMITFRNTGGGTLTVTSVSIDAKTNTTITFSSATPQIKIGTGSPVAGTAASSVPSAGITGSTMVIPAGQSVTLTWTLLPDFTSAFDVGMSYNAYAMQSSGQPIQFKLSIPSL